MVVKADTLLDILRQEKDIFCELIDLSCIEQECIMQNDIMGLLDVTGKKERLAYKIVELEQSRKILVKSTDDDRSNTTNSLQELKSSFDLPLSEEADRIKDELLSVLTELTHVNQTNSELLKRNLDYVNFMLDTIMPNDNPMYTNTSEVNNSSPRLFDGRA